MAKATTLKLSHRIELASLAIAKFANLELRAREDKLERGVIDSFNHDYDREILPNLDLLNKCVKMHETDSIQLPVYNDGIPILVDREAVTRPDGVDISRSPAKKYVKSGARRDYVIKNSYELSAFMSGKSRPQGSSGYHTVTSIISSLSNHRKLLVPNTGYFSVYFPHEVMEEMQDKDRQYFSRNGSGGHPLNWISDRTINLMADFFRASAAREEAENEMWRGMIAFILAAKTFDEVVQFWPEAETKRLAFFPPVGTIRAVPTALITLSDDVKKKLCNSMASRGVESVLCSIAA